MFSPFSVSRPLLDRFYNSIVNEIGYHPTQANKLRSICDEFVYAIIVAKQVSLSDVEVFISQCYQQGLFSLSLDRFRPYGMSVILQPYICVSNLLPHSCGDDWNYLYQSALRCGLIITKKYTSPSVREWNQELSSLLPNFFSPNDFDEEDILRRILDVAQQGKDEHYTFPEYIGHILGVTDKTEFFFQKDLSDKLVKAIIRFASDAGLQISKKLTPLPHTHQYYTNIQSSARFRDSLRIQDSTDVLLKHIQHLKQPTDKPTILCYHLWRVATTFASQISLPTDVNTQSILWSVFLYSIRDIIEMNKINNSIIKAFESSACHLFNLTIRSTKLLMAQKLQDTTYLNLVHDNFSITCYSGLNRILQNIQAVVYPEVHDLPAWKVHELAIFISDITECAIELYPM